MAQGVSGRLLRLIVAVALTTYILYRSDPSAVLSAAAGADLSLIALAVLLALVDRALMAYRWIALLCIVDRADRPSLARLLEIFFVSTFLGTFLPASVGGDAVRAYSLSRDRVSGSEAVASVFMDRMLGVASLLLLGVAGIALAPGLRSNAAVVSALAVTGVVCALTLATIFSLRTGAWVAATARLVPLRRARQMADGIVAAVQRYRHFHGELTGVLLASVAVQVLRIVQAYCLGRAVGITAGLPVYFAFVPLILLVMLLPITINGLGTSQAAFVWFFGRASVAPPLAFALSVLFVGLGIVGNLPGGILYAMRGLVPAGPRPGAGGART